MTPQELEELGLPPQAVPDARRSSQMVEVLSLPDTSVAVAADVTWDAARAAHDAKQTFGTPGQFDPR